MQLKRLNSCVHDWMIDINVTTDEAITFCDISSKSNSGEVLLCNIIFRPLGPSIKRKQIDEDNWW